MSECARVLIVEGSLEEVRFIEEALAEAQETRRTGVQFDCLHLESYEDASILLAAERFHVVLLGCVPVNGAAIESFRMVRSLAPATAIIVVLEPEDRPVAASFLRDGAQDFLLRGRFDYETLARAIENALERQKYLAASQSVAMNDPETGLLTANAFMVLGRGMWPLLARAGAEVCLVLVETGSPEPLVEFACSVRLRLPGTTLVARLGATRFAMLGEFAINEAMGFIDSCRPPETSFQAGVAQRRARECEFEMLLEQAEAVLSDSTRAARIGA